MYTGTAHEGLLPVWTVEALWASYWCEGTGRMSDPTSLAAQGGDKVTTLPIMVTVLCCTLDIRLNGAYHQITVILLY